MPTLRRHLLIAYSLAALCAAWALWANIDRAIEGIHASFANEQMAIFADMRVKAQSSNADEAIDCLEYTTRYYPSGTKQTLGSRLDCIVERARAEAVAAIIAHLRNVTGEDWGDNPA